MLLKLIDSPNQANGRDPSQTDVSDHLETCMSDCLETGESDNLEVDESDHLDNRDCDHSEIDDIDSLPTEVRHRLQTETSDHLHMDKSIDNETCYYCGRVDVLRYEAESGIVRLCSPCRDYINQHPRELETSKAFLWFIGLLYISACLTLVGGWCAVYGVAHAALWVLGKQFCMPVPVIDIPSIFMVECAVGMLMLGYLRRKEFGIMLAFCSVPGLLVYGFCWLVSYEFYEPLHGIDLFFLIVVILWIFIVEAEYRMFIWRDNENVRSLYKKIEPAVKSYRRRTITEDNMEE